MTLPYPARLTIPRAGQSDSVRQDMPESASIRSHAGPWHSDVSRPASPSHPDPTTHLIVRTCLSDKPRLLMPISTPIDCPRQAHSPLADRSAMTQPCQPLSTRRPFPDRSRTDKSSRFPPVQCHADVPSRTPLRQAFPDRQPKPDQPDKPNQAEPGLLPTYRQLNKPKPQPTIG